MNYKKLFLAFVVFVLVSGDVFVSAQIYASQNNYPTMGSNFDSERYYGSSSGLGYGNSYYNRNQGSNYYGGSSAYSDNYYQNSYGGDYRYQGDYYGGGRSFSGGLGGYSYSSSQRQPYYDTFYSQQDYATFWPRTGGQPESCDFGQDLLLNVPPGGCQPTVVRSDLLEEQNVPVFCQIDSFQINPLVDTRQIRNIRFSGGQSEYVTGVGFQPTLNHLSSGTAGLFSNPLTSNIGYAVVVLKQQPNEDAMPDSVNVTLSAQVDYETNNAFGIGAVEFVLETMAEEEWRKEKDRQTFWRGKYSVRLDDVNPNSASISFYEEDLRVASARLLRGQSSQEIYLPGSFCQVGVQAYYDNFVGTMPKARIEISDDRGVDEIDVFPGSRFLDNRCWVDRVLINPDGRTGGVLVSCGGERFALELKKKSSAGTSNSTDLFNETFLVDKSLEPLRAEQAFSESVADFERVAEMYPEERIADYEGGERYGERALKEAIELTETPGFEKEFTKDKLISDLIETYPDSQGIGFYKNKLGGLSEFDTSKSAYAPFVSNRYTTIRLKSLSEPKQNSRAKFFVDNKAINVFAGKRSEEVTGADGGKVSFTLERLESDRARITGFCNGKKERTGDLYIGDSVTVCGSVVQFSDSDVQRAAVIRLNPLTHNQRAGTMTNVTINIGIEKRAIEVSPTKAMDKIDDLNKTIKKWGDISENLGNVVMGMKSACFATSALLNFKNFLSGMSGEAIARQKVMRGEKGWTTICENKVAEGEFTGLDHCFTSNADKINADVGIMEQAVNNVNSEIQEIQENYKISSGIFGDSVDTDKVKARVVERLIGSHGADEIKLPLNKKWNVYEGGRIVSSKDTVTVKELVDSGQASLSELRELWMNLESRDAGLSPNQKENVLALLSDSADRVNDYRGLSFNLDRAKARESLGHADGFVPRETASREQAVSIVPSSVHGNLFDSYNSGAGETQRIAHAAKAVVEGRVVHGRDGQVVTTFEPGEYVLGLQQADDGKYIVRQVFDEKGKAVNAAQFTTAYKIGTLTSIDNVNLNNEIRKADRFVRYYEVEPYKGMPAVVPFDLRRGWYAATKPQLPVFGGIGAFDASGRVSNFLLCNVGENGKVEYNEGYGDDICQRVDLDTGQEIGFPGLNKDEGRRLVQDAVRAINDAVRQQSSGGGSRAVNINGQILDVGEPAVGIPGTQCQDFMPPEDCHLMFNVCDPVICPSSRCDFGGKYPVADVVQSGIVGSVLLCLPNIQEGIAIPVCLTGIKAGIDGLVGIMRSYRDCLQENVETGRLVGICDEVYSIYLCEFFWRQVAPVANVLIPKLFEIAYGQGVRGGGEYLTVQSAWQNMQNSVNYFTESYAANSIRAFRMRNIEEAGGEFCKAFTSVKAPKTFEALIEPDSPPQFHAWFDSFRYSGATVPPTAQYKVFYNIFAGKDIGTYYQVYLRRGDSSFDNIYSGGGYGYSGSGQYGRSYGSSFGGYGGGGSGGSGGSAYSSFGGGSSYYQTNPTFLVDSGFIPLGETISETVDFTAPEGYRELCVVVNGQEECGFKQVSTSFAINYLRDEYVADELTEARITSEQECISGSPHPGALLNPNIQSGVEEAAMPQIYERGVVRICATDNPGKGTEPSRYVDMGYCGEQKMRCWLDTKSVDRAITDNNLGVREAVLGELGEINRENMMAQGEVFRLDQADAELKFLEDRLEDLRASVEKTGLAEELLAEIDFIFEKLVLNNHKARALLLRGRVNAELASGLAVRAEASLGGFEEDDFVGPLIPDEGAGECVLSNPRWSAGSAKEGDVVEASVEASEGCAGKTVEFDIFEDDITPFFDTKQVTLSADYSGERFVVSWAVPLLGDVSGGPEFYFVAYIDGSEVRSGLLRVGDVGGVVEEEVPVEEEELSLVERLSFNFDSADNSVVYYQGDDGNIVSTGLFVPIGTLVVSYEEKTNIVARLSRKIDSNLKAGDFSAITVEPDKGDVGVLEGKFNVSELVGKKIVRKEGGELAIE